MNIILARSDEEIASCYAVMRELRPHIEEESFVIGKKARHDLKGARP